MPSLIRVLDSQVLWSREQSVVALRKQNLQWDNYQIERSQVSSLFVCGEKEYEMDNQLWLILLFMGVTSQLGAWGHSQYIRLKLTLKSDLKKPSPKDMHNGNESGTDLFCRRKVTPTSFHSRAGRSQSAGNENHHCKAPLIHRCRTEHVRAITHNLIKTRTMRGCTVSELRQIPEEEECKQSTKINNN